MPRSRLASLAWALRPKASKVICCLNLGPCKPSWEDFTKFIRRFGRLCAAVRCLRPCLSPGGSLRLKPIPALRRWAHGVWAATCNAALQPWHTMRGSVRIWPSSAWPNSPVVGYGTMARGGMFPVKMARQNWRKICLWGKLPPRNAGTRGRPNWTVAIRARKPS